MTELCFSESIHPHFRITMQIDSVLAQETSDFQSILLFTNKDFGTVLALDGVVQTTTADEHIYHEMMAHVPLVTTSEQVNCAIIGGGDGGVLREVLKHKNVGSCTMIEIDKRVIELSKQFLPSISAGAFEDPRATVLCEDGAKWLASSSGLDIVLIDSSDPVGPNESLFGPSFYATLAKAVNPRAIIVKQSGVTLVQQDEAIETLLLLRQNFKYYGLYRQNVPTYVGGDMLYAWA